MKKAYMVVEITISDVAAFEEYRSQVVPTLDAVGARFLVRGGTRRQLEGADAAHHDQLRTIVVEFPSTEVALAWYESPEYAPLKQLRMSASEARMFMVEGI